MTEQQLQAIEKRWAKATPGKWEWIIRGNSVESRAVVCHNDAVSLNPQNICFGISPKTGNAQAIANAPGDIAALLAEVRRLNERIEKMKSEACPPVHCPDGIKCSKCWDDWMTNVCNEMREKEAADNG